MKKIRILILFVMVITACAACGRKKGADVDHKKAIKKVFESKQEIVIDCFGDSITWGQFVTDELNQQIADGTVRPSLDDGGQLFEDYGIYISSVYQSDPTYPESLEKNLNDLLRNHGSKSMVKTANDGISGDWLTKDSYTRILCDPDIVLILYCGNNYYFDQPCEGTLEANIDALRNQGRIVYLLTYPLYPDQLYTGDFADANAYIRKTAEKKQVRLIDTYEKFEEAVKKQYDRRDLFSNDKIHLSETGYDLLGYYAAEAIFADLT